MSPHLLSQGGLVGNDETVALTAFVVIALQHGLNAFQDQSAEALKQRVVRTVWLRPALAPSSSLLSRHRGSSPRPSLSSRKPPS